MKKFIIIFWIIYGLNAFSQHAFQDALFIRENLITTDAAEWKFKNEINNISQLIGKLSQYLPRNIANPETLESGQLLELFVENPLFGKQIEILGNSVESGVEPFGFANKISSIGGLDVTSFADGLAKFLVKRTKEELYVSFFEKLADTSDFPEFKILFPRTWNLVNNFKSWEYANIINTLKESFEKDLKELLKNLPKFAGIVPENLTKNDQVKKRLEAIKKAFSGTQGRILLSAMKAGQGILSQQKIPDIIHDISGPDYLGGLTDNPTVKNTIRLIDILSMSVRSNTPGRNYISKTEFEKLLEDPITIRIFTGLVYQQVKNEHIFINEINLAERLAHDIVQTIKGIEVYYQELSEMVELAELSFKEFKLARSKGETDLTVSGHALFGAVNDIFGQLLKIDELIPGLVIPKSVFNVFETAGEVLEISHDIAVRNYSGAITATLNFIIRNGGNQTDLKGFNVFLVKYGSFAANVVQAKSSDEVEKAIESVVLPVGSASIKKYSSFNIALNAYVGLFGGEQKLRTDNDFVGAAGVYAPVGINFSWGTGKKSRVDSVKKYKPASFSLFATVIDISPLVTYRFTNFADTLASDLKVRLNQIFSPGMHVIFGLPKLPISVGGGFNWSPLITKVEKEKITTLNEENRPFRWQIFLAVDIPLLNFYTKYK